MGLLALAANTARRIGELGFIVGAIGGVLFIAAAAVRANRARGNPGRGILMAAGVCITVGFVLGIVALHWGRV